MAITSGSSADPADLARHGVATRPIATQRDAGADAMHIEQTATRVAPEDQVRGALTVCGLFENLA
jgi:hypothetical protein